MLNTRVGYVAILLGFLLLSAGVGQAHYLWLEGPAIAAEDEQVQVEVHWGHLGDEGGITDVNVYSRRPDGRREVLKAFDRENYQAVTLQLSGPGDYWLYTVRPPSVYQRTLGHFSAKHLLRVGYTDDAAWEKPVGTLLEVVPLAHPHSLDDGDVLPVRILFEGSPLVGAVVTHVNVEGIQDTVLTDDAGEVLLTVVDGAQLIAASHETPAVGEEDYDLEGYTAVLYLNL